MEESIKYSRKTLWNKAFPNEVPNIISKNNFCTIFKIEYKYLLKLRETIYQCLYSVDNVPEKLGEEKLPTKKQVKDFLDKAPSVKINYDMELMTQLDATLHEMLYSYELLPNIQGIEFPVNLRVIQSEVPKKYLSNEYATDHIHCDPWAGSPKDAVNCILYIDVDENSSFCKVYDVKKQDMEKISQYTGPYKKGCELINNITEINYKPEPGVMLMFDAFTPHETVRRGSKSRISIDFRLRRKDPYEILDQRWLSRNVSWAKYWYLNKIRTKSYSTRLNNELALLKKNPVAIEFRKKALGKV